MQDHLFPVFSSSNRVSRIVLHRTGRFQRMASVCSSRPMWSAPVVSTHLSLCDGFLRIVGNMVKFSVFRRWPILTVQNYRGLIGPARQFGIGMMYNPILYWLLVGAVLPVPFYLLGRRYPNSWLQYVNIPVLFTGAVYMPPATGINYSSWFLFGFIFRKPSITFALDWRN